jgi:transcriptional regulator with XRE-family HTH domain
MNIGNTIKTIRKNSGLTQKEFVKKIKISQTYLSQIECDYRKPSWEILERIAEVCDYPLPLLFFKGLSISDFPSKNQGAANNNRKRTNGRKIHVQSLTKLISFKINETELFINGYSHIMKEHFRYVLRPTSKRTITVPQ